MNQPLRDLELRREELFPAMVNRCILRRLIGRKGPSACGDARNAMRAGLTKKA